MNANEIFINLQVSERLSNPNIFIAHNRSDAFAGEETQVRSVGLKFPG